MRGTEVDAGTLVERGELRRACSWVDATCRIMHNGARPNHAQLDETLFGASVMRATNSGWRGIRQQYRLMHNVKRVGVYGSALVWAGRAMCQVQAGSTQAACVRAAGR